MSRLVTGEATATSISFSCPKAMSMGHLSPCLRSVYLLLFSLSPPPPSSFALYRVWVDVGLGIFHSSIDAFKSCNYSDLEIFEHPQWRDSHSGYLVFVLLCSSSNVGRSFWAIFEPLLHRHQQPISAFSKNSQRRLYNVF